MAKNQQTLLSCASRINSAYLSFKEYLLENEEELIEADDISHIRILKKSFSPIERKLKKLDKAIKKIKV